MTHEHRKDVHNVPRLATENFLTVRVREFPTRAAAILSQCDTFELSHFVQSVVKMGYVVSFTATSDGGAIALTVFDGATKFKGYVRNADEFAVRFRDLLSAVRGES